MPSGKQGWADTVNWMNKASTISKVNLYIIVKFWLKNVKLTTFKNNDTEIIEFNGYLTIHSVLMFSRHPLFF